MDRIIEKKKWTARKIGMIAASIGLVSLLLYSFILKDTSSKLNVELQQLNIATVEQGEFQEFIPVDAIVEPAKTIYLDVLMGGRVDNIFVEDGSDLKAGDTILKLSNPNMMLDYLNKETQMYDIINNLESTQIGLEQNQYKLKKQLIELKTKMEEAKKTYERNTTLFNKELISEKDFEDSKRNCEAIQKQMEIEIVSQKHDSIYAQKQIANLSNSVNRMKQNLQLVKENLNNLYVLAPISGQLSSLNAEIGELKNSGDRIGQIDVTLGYKLNAKIDEHYISRTYVGQSCEMEHANKTYKLEVSKIYPEVKNGSFKIDVMFTDSIPADIKRGQSFQLRLFFSGVSQATFVKRGGFFQETGGNWIYVLDKEEKIAVKREIKIGKQNTRYYEVLDGLEVGEKVIVSSYSGFGEKDKLVIKD
jgi:HlyD family secretion protein